MRLTIVTALSGIAAVALALSGLSANAAPKKRTPAASQADVSVSSQSRARRLRRSRTRITVRPRSYLDGGTEVIPGERKYTDYAISPAFRGGFSPIEHTVFHHRHPLPGPFELSGRNNPVGW